MKNQIVPQVSIIDGVPMTTSRHIAEYFGKWHKDVLRAIRNAKCTPEFARLNFKPGSYQDTNNQSRPMYQLTKEGFVFITVGFTGREAGRLKEAFVPKFNQIVE